MAGDYSQSIPVESFLDQGRSKRGGEASPDIAKLPGVRMLRTSEPGRNAKFDEGLIKLLTGGDKISARHLNRNFFEFLPVFKLTMQGNHKPKIQGVDEGIWSRIFLDRRPHADVRRAGEGAGGRRHRRPGVRWMLSWALPSRYQSET